MERKDIVFINGLVKSREKYLIGEQSFLRMAEAADADEAFKLLREFNFGGEAFADAKAYDYEKIISAEWERFKAFLDEYAPSESFLRCINARNDFFNAEFAVREKNLKAGAVYMPEGVYKVESLKKAADGKLNVPKFLSEPMKSAQKLFDEDTVSGAEVSTLFLRAYYAYMLVNVKNADWKSYVVHEIDAKNISIAFRSKDLAQAQKYFIGGGKLPKKVFENILHGDEEKARDLTKQTPYFDLIKLGFEEKNGGGALVEFERAADGFAMKLLKSKRFETDGIIPMLLYANYKINELKNVRIVLSMKLCGADKENVKRRLRECYAG